MTEESLKQQIISMEQKAEETLTDARILFNQERYASASSRAYYAVFHILQAVLLTKGLSFSRHSGVISGFSKYFVKEGIFPAEYAEKIKKLWKNREIGDYGYVKKIEKEEARKCLSDAEEIINTFRKYLRGFI